MAARGANPAGREPDLTASSIHVLSLGRFTVQAAGTELTGLLAQPVRCALLLYLLAEREASRDRLTALFWPDRNSEQARHILNQTIYLLRQTFGPTSIRSSGGSVTLAENFRIDVAAFEEAAARGDHAGAFRLYTGHFAEDPRLAVTPEFGEWLEARRARLQRLYRKVCRGYMAELRQRDDGATALAAARTWSELEPFDDEANHHLVDLLYRSGDRLAALSHFEEYRIRIESELQVQPLKDTLELVERIRSSPGSGPVVAESTSTAPAAAAADGPGRLRRWRGGRTRLVHLPGVLAAFAIILVATIAKAVTDAAFSGEPSSLSLPRPVAGLDVTRLVILDFDVVGDDARTAAIARGLTEALATELREIPALSLPSLQSVRRLQQSGVTHDSIAALMRAGSITAGTVQISGDNVRVSIELIDATGLTDVQSASLQRPVRELFALQDELASRVVTFLRIRLGDRVRRERMLSENPDFEAYVLVHQALDLADGTSASGPAGVPDHSLTRARLASADSLLRTARLRDPDWPEPYIQRGWIYLGMARLSGTADTVIHNELLRSALAQADTALRLQSAHARGHELRGTVLMQLARVNSMSTESPTLLAQADQELRQATTLDNTLASAWNTLSRLRLYAGDPAEANVLALTALAADPFLEDGPDVMYRLYRTSLDLQQFDDAAESCLEGRLDFPADWRFTECELSLASWTPTGSMMPDSAAALLDRLDALDPAPAAGPIRYPHLHRRMLFAHILAKSGAAQAARDSLSVIEAAARGRRDLELPLLYDAAYLHLLLGDHPRARETIDAYLEHHPQHHDYILNDFVFTPLFRESTAGTPPHRQSAPR